MGERFPHGEFYVALRGTDLVLDVTGSSTDSGAAVIIYSIKHSANQRWTWDREDKLLRNVHSGLALSFPGLSAGANASQAEGHGSDNQRFEYYDHTISAAANEDIVLAALVKEEGAVVGLAPRDNDDWNQQWEIRRAD